MKQLFFAFLFIPLFASSQEYDAPNDTTIVTMMVGKCGIKENNYAMSVEMQNYLSRFETVNLVANVEYRGEAIIDGEYRECVIIYRLTFSVSGRKK